MAIPVCTRQMDDHLAWNFERNGLFSVRSAYQMLADTKRRREDWLEGRSGSSDIEAEAKSWETLWSVQVPGKIQHFMWRLSKLSIPTEDVRHARKMADDDKRQLCGMRDSWRHSLVECSAARCVWALVDENILDFLQSTEEPNARVWLFSAFEHLPHDSLVTMMVTMWAIWWARRRVIHEGDLQSPHATHSFVKSFIAELATIRAGTPTPNGEQQTGARPAAGQGWRAPEAGAVKI